MKSLQTIGIVLGRTDYGEADRIITFLTPNYGKLRLMARGVRKVKSKLAGGIELFSTSDISFIKGRGEIGTLISTRLISHYGHIVSDHDRLQLGYDLLKLLNQVTQDMPEADYYHLLEQAFKALDEATVPPEIIKAWFIAQLLRLGGHTPNLHTDTAGSALSPSQTYSFDFNAVAFSATPRGNFSASHIKVLRLLFEPHTPQQLKNVQGIDEHLPAILPLTKNLQATYLPT